MTIFRMSEAAPRPRRRSGSKMKPLGILTQLRPADFPDFPIKSYAKSWTNRFESSPTIYENWPYPPDGTSYLLSPHHTLDVLIY